MYAAFGKPGAIRQAPDALLAVCTNRVENDNTLGPQSHGVGPCSEGWLQLEKSALQSTRSTAGCPALRGCPLYIPPPPTPKSATEPEIVTRSIFTSPGKLVIIMPFGTARLMIAPPPSWSALPLTSSRFSIVMIGLVAPRLRLVTSKIL